ncbi:MAG TPA: DUF433 domain-containing protein, partial [Opitutaceae bacterium]
TVGFWYFDVRPYFHGDQADGRSSMLTRARSASAALSGIAGNRFAIIFPCMRGTSYRYLTNIPGVRSGRTIIEATRIGVHDVVGLIVNGASVDDVCRSFPGVTRAQVYECVAYYEDHRVEIDALVAQQMREGPA